MSTSVSITGLILLLAILVLWVGLLANVADPNSSDAAGNGYQRAFAAMFAIVIWIMLAVLLIMAALKGNMPGWTVVLAWILVPASGAAAVFTGELIAESDSGIRWLIAVPALVPPLLVFFAMWAYFPSFHSSIPANLTGGVVWGAVLILSLAPLPVSVRQNRERRERMARIEKEAEESRVKFAKLVPDAPLWEWIPFIGSTNPMQVQALEHIRNSPTRQADAEIMLERGDFPAGILFELKLDPTPELCQKFRNFLSKRAVSLPQEFPPSLPYKVVAEEIDQTINAMHWLAENHCDCHDLGASYLALATSYKNSKDGGWNLHQLKEISEGRQ